MCSMDGSSCEETLTQIKHSSRETDTQPWIWRQRNRKTKADKDREGKYIFPVVSQENVVPGSVSYLG